MQMANLQNPQPVSLFTSPLGTTLAVPAATGAIPLAISMPATSPTAAVGVIANSLFSNRLALGARISAGESENKVRTLSAAQGGHPGQPGGRDQAGAAGPLHDDRQFRAHRGGVPGRLHPAQGDAAHHQRQAHLDEGGGGAVRSLGIASTSPADSAFPINTRKATTNVLVSNGSTIVIGGLLQSDERWTESRIPWISKVPVLGSLFKSTSIGPEGKIELLIFLTPTILEEPKI